MRKKLLVMLMTLCMLVVLAACGNVDNTVEAERSAETVEENEDGEGAFRRRSGRLRGGR